MAISLTASLSTSPAGVPRVKLDAVWTTAPVPTSVTIYRSDPFGARHVVRQADPLVLAAGLGTCYDYEAPLDLTSSWVVSNGTTEVSSGSLTPTTDGVPWLVHAGLPELSVPLSWVTAWPSWSRSVAQGVFSVLGRRTPVVVSGRRQAESGTLEVVTDSEDATDRMRAILADGTPLLLKGTSRDEPVPRWLAVGDVSESPLDRNGTLRSLVAWSLPAQVVDAPAGQALAAVQYANASAEFSSYADAKAQAPTYADRTAGAWL